MLKPFLVIFQASFTLKSKQISTYTMTFVSEGLIYNNLQKIKKEIQFSHKIMENWQYIFPPNAKNLGKHDIKAVLTLQNSKIFLSIFKNSWHPSHCQLWWTKTVNESTKHSELNRGSYTGPNNRTRAPAPREDSSAYYPLCNGTFALAMTDFKIHPSDRTQDN